MTTLVADKQQALKYAKLFSQAPVVTKALAELVANLEGLASEFTICQEVLDSSYGKAAKKALKLARVHMKTQAKKPKVMTVEDWEDPP